MLSLALNTERLKEMQLNASSLLSEVVSLPISTSQSKLVPGGASARIALLFPSLLLAPL